MATCRTCGEDKGVDSFHRKARDGQMFYAKICKTCDYSAKNLVTKAARTKLKLLVIRKLGGICYCCSEYRIEFLSVEHILRDGMQDRRNYGGALSMYRAIRDSRADITKYKVLCLNCNLSMGFYGYCPHERERQKVVFIG